MRRQESLELKLIGRALDSLVRFWQRLFLASLDTRPAGIIQSNSDAA